VRIVLVDPRGDSRPYDHGLGAALAARGHDVRLVTCRFRHGSLPAAPGVAVQERFYRLGDRLPGPLRRLGRGCEHVADLIALLPLIRSADVAHVMWLPLGPADRAFWRVARMLTRTQLVHTAHNAIVKDGVGSADQVRADCAPFARIVVHSHAGEAALVRLGVPMQKITRIPHAALTGYADVVAVPPDLPDGVPVALFAGLIRPYKGLSDLLDAWPSVRRRVPGAVLHVLGRSLGSDADAERAATTEGVVADLRYAEPGEWAGAMRRADVVVLPYRSIDQSGVLATAIALGRPVIATDVGGFGETLADTGAGLLVPPRDPAVLGATIAALLLDADLRARLAAAAAAAARGELSWDRSAERHEVVYARTAA
jgi:glycosyltransferase involved in cell wall biosynthesis